MKTMKKMMVLVLAIAMVLGTSVMTAFAADITVENATKGQTYKAFKIFNAVYSTDGNKVVYTVPSTLESQVSAPFSVSTAKAKNGEKIVVLADGTTEAQVIAWAKANYSKFDSTGTTLTYGSNGTATATGLAAGYYYVTSTLGAMVTIQSVNATATVVDKNESKPEKPSKVITAENTTAINPGVETNDAAVGSKESFEVTFNATNWVQGEDSDSTAGSATPADNTKVTVWNFTDTPTGLDIDKSTVKVFVNGTDVTSNIPADNISKSDAGVLTINIPWVDANGASLYDTKTEGSELIPVKVTYDATITAAAAAAAAPNTVDVKYNTNKDLGTDTTTTYTYKFQLDKVDENNDPLTGAQFQLKDSTGAVIKLVATDDGYRKALTDNEQGAVDTIDMTAKASVVISGLDKADYTLVETQVPDGYTKAADTTVSANSLTKVGDTLPETAAALVVNRQGTVLPSTGGMGTTILYIMGGALVVVCGIMLVAKKRTSNK